MGGIHSPFFLPFENPIGFGLSDFIELGAALVLILFVFVQPWIQPGALRLARRPGWSLLLLACAPVLLRVALLATHPAPSPHSPADYSQLLSADTLLHFRLANPPHPMHRFFETIWVSQQPAYNSIFPVGEGMALAFGRLLFGHPWAGVMLCVSVFCAASYWMLRAWTAPGWALLGGVVAVLEWGPLSEWMNSYTGGALPAAAVCLVAGSLPRLRRHGRIRDGVLLGFGLAAALLTSVHLFAVLLVVAALSFLSARKIAFAAALPLIVAATAITLFQNHAATGSWTTRPESVYRPVTPEQILASRVQSEREGYRRFSPLAPAIILLLSTVVFQRMSRWNVGREAARIAVFLCFAHFLFWFLLAAFTSPDRSRIRPSPERASLVFVRYGERHRFTNEWVYNDADVDTASVVWARDRGPEENAKLRRYYLNRSVWLLDADAADPALVRYDPAPAVVPLPEPAPARNKLPPLRFEEVPDAR